MVDEDMPGILPEPAEGRKSQLDSFRQDPSFFEPLARK
jgi:hypothetical protein